MRDLTAKSVTDAHCVWSIRHSLPGYPRQIRVNCSIPIAKENITLSVLNGFLTCQVLTGLHGLFPDI